MEGLEPWARAGKRAFACDARVLMTVVGENSLWSCDLYLDWFDSTVVGKNSLWSCHVHVCVVSC